MSYILESRDMIDAIYTKVLYRKIVLYTPHLTSPIFWICDTAGNCIEVHINNNTKKELNDYTDRQQQTTTGLKKEKEKKKKREIQKSLFFLP
jgi:hypothetical protein